MKIDMENTYLQSRDMLSIACESEKFATISVFYPLIRTLLTEGWCDLISFIDKDDFDSDFIKLILIRKFSIINKWQFLVQKCYK